MRKGEGCTSSRRIHVRDRCQILLSQVRTRHGVRNIPNTTCSEQTLTRVWRWLHKLRRGRGRYPRHRAGRHPLDKNISQRSQRGIGKYLQQTSELTRTEKTKYLSAQTVPGSIASDGARIDKSDILNTVLVTQDGIFFLKGTDELSDQQVHS
jgi:hypothetical protein